MTRGDLVDDETRFYYDQAIAAQRRMEGLEAEVERLRAWGERFEQSFYDTSSKAAEYREEIARLRQLLVEYGRHTEGCSAAHGDQYRCRCGWRDVEREFK
jgi:hypothetical protein